MNDCCKNEFRAFADMLAAVCARQSWWVRAWMRLCGAQESIARLVAMMRSMDGEPPTVTISGCAFQCFVRGCQRPNAPHSLHEHG